MYISLEMSRLTSHLSPQCLANKDLIWDQHRDKILKHFQLRIVDEVIKISLAMGTVF